MNTAVTCQLAILTTFYYRVLKISLRIAVFHILLQHQIYIEPLVAPFPKPGPIGGSLLVLVKGGALGCGAPWRQARQPHQVSELPLGTFRDRLRSGKSKLLQLLQLQRNGKE